MQGDNSWYFAAQNPMLTRMNDKTEVWLMISRFFQLTVYGMPKSSSSWPEGLVTLIWGTNGSSTFEKQTIQTTASRNVLWLSWAEKVSIKNHMQPASIAAIAGLFIQLEGLHLKCQDSHTQRWNKKNTPMQSENKKLKMQPYQQNRQDRTVVVFLLRNAATGRSGSHAAGRRTALRKAEVKRQVVHCVWRKRDYNTSTNTCSFLSKAFPWALFFPFSPTTLLPFFLSLPFLGVISSSFLVYAFCILFGSSIFMSSSLSVPKHRATTEPVSITKATQPKQAQDGSHQLKGRPSILSSFNACSGLDCLGPTWTTSGSFCSTAAFPSQSSFSFGLHS